VPNALFRFNLPIDAKNLQPVCLSAPRVLDCDSCCLDGRGYLAVAVSVLHPGASPFKPVQQNTPADVVGMPIRRCTGTHLRVPERTMVHPRDALIPRFVMMGSGGSNPSCGTAMKSSTCGPFWKWRHGPKCTEFVRRRRRAL